MPPGTYQNGESQYVTRHELELFARPIVEGLAGLNENVAALRKELASTRIDVGNVRLSQRPSTGTVVGFMGAVLGTAISIGMGYFMVIDTREELTEARRNAETARVEAVQAGERIVRLETLAQAYIAWPPQAAPKTP